MSDKLIRTYQKFNTADITPHLLVYGAISGNCAKCDKMDIKVDMPKCPGCDTPFHYIAFRQPKQHMPKLYKLLENNPNLTIVDYDDYKKYIGASKAEDFFK